MHKKLLNEATFYLTISAEGPLLVKSGLEGWDPTLPDMQFMRTRHAQLGETVFIPGSSIKGTLRSYSEKIARTLNVECCDPFDRKLSCSGHEKFKPFTEKNDGRAIYLNSCVACKLYGSMNIASRAAFADAYPTKDISKYLTKRTAVAIDRVLGSVAVGPFDFEALTSGDFTTQIRLRNFELWQLGLLGLALRDLCLGRVRIGFGKSRGFGSVSARLDKLELRSIVEEGISIKDGKLRVKGIGAMLSKEDCDAYGIAPEEQALVEAPTSLGLVDDVIGVGLLFERRTDSSDWCAPEAYGLFSKCVKASWAKYAESHQSKGAQNG